MRYARIHLEEIFGADDRAAYRAYATVCRLTSVRLGVATPTIFSAAVVGIFRIDGGRLVERWGPWKLEKL